MLKSIAILALAASVSAQTVTSLYLPGFGQGEEELVGSVIASDSAATTYSIVCSDPDSDGCDVPSSFTYTQGPSTVHYIYSESDSPDDNETVEFGCTITHSESGSCSGLYQGFEAGSTISSATTASFTDAATDLGGVPVTITAGLTATAPTASPTASPTGSTSDVGTSTSTGGVPRVTGGAWVVGAAGALALAAL